MHQSPLSLKSTPPKIKKRRKKLMMSGISVVHLMPSEFTKTFKIICVSFVIMFCWSILQHGYQHTVIPLKKASSSFSSMLNSPTALLQVSDVDFHQIQTLYFVINCWTFAINSVLEWISLILARFTKFCLNQNTHL